MPKPYILSFHLKIAIPFIGLVSIGFGSLVASNKPLMVPAKKDTIIIRGNCKLQSLLTVKEIAGIFKDKEKLDVNRDYDAYPGRFYDKDKPFDILVYNDWPSAQYRLMLKYCIPEKEKQPEMYEVGQLRLLIIVNKNNTLSQIDIPTICRVFGEENEKLKWSDVGGKGDKIACYTLAFTSWPMYVFRERCMRYERRISKGVIGRGYVPFTSINVLEDSRQIISKVGGNSNAIGIVPLTSELKKSEFDKVKILAVMDKETPAYTTPLLDSVIQNNYALTEHLILYLHPKAPPVAKEFCEFAVGPEGAKIAAKYGLITPYAEKQYLAEKYVKMMKAGEGPAIGMTGSVSLRNLANGLIIESVKSNGPVQFKYTDASETTAANSFLNREDVYMMLLDSPLSERTMKYVESSWKEVKPVEHIIGGEALAIIVNPANTTSSLTPDQVRGLFSRQIKDWRFVAAKTKEGGGNSRVECFGERLNTPAAKLFMDTVMPSRKISGVKYRKTAGGVIASVAMDAGSVGFANAALIDPEDKAVKILPIGPFGKAVLPTDETIINGQYPFSRKLYLYVKPNVPDAVKTIVKFLLSPEAAEAFKTNGYFPAPQPQPVKHHKKSATTQPTTKPVIPTKPTTQPSTSKAA